MNFFLFVLYVHFSKVLHQQTMDEDIAADVVYFVARFPGGGAEFKVFDGHEIRIFRYINGFIILFRNRRK